MENEFVCKFCNKKFPSGKSLGGHIRIHSPKKFSVDSDSFIGIQKKKKRLVGQREITPPKQKQQKCRVCGKGFCSMKALDNHMDCHNYEGEEKKLVMDTQSASETTTATTTSSGPTMIKRPKKHSNSEFGSLSSDPEIVQGAKDLMFLHLGRKECNFAVNSLVPDSSENNSEILETKSSSGELLLKKPDKVAADDDSDDGSSDSDYFMKGAEKSDSDISVGGSLRNTGVGSGFNSFKDGDELRNKEGGGSKHELSKRKRVSPFYESDSSADINSKIHHRSSDSKSPRVMKAIGGANKNSKVHECPICFKVYSSAQALGGHKRSHTIIANQEAERIKHKAAADKQFDLNLPAEEDSDDD
ncbi:hypothetical protein N665_0183s0033 [Sinapis alba]|nr:hypothetical protein N665_0183s0033 [Sinapis alba]